MKNWGQKKLSSDVSQSSGCIAWGSAAPRQRGFKGGGGDRHSGK
jgi:hypothetical protein